MSAFVNLPWLPSSDQFLKAILAGAEHGAEMSRIRQASEARGGGGGSFMAMPSGPSAYEQARTAALVGEEKRKADATAGERAAWELSKSLISRGATPQQAYDEAGLAQFGAKEPIIHSDVTPISLGRGGLGLFNKSTGTVTIPREPAPEKAAADPRYSGPTTKDIFGKPAGVTRLTLGEWAKLGPSLPDEVRTNPPVADFIKWGMPNGGTNSSAMTTAAPAAKAAQGGYKVGATYSGLRYLGGDPNDESNWEQSK